MNPGTHSQFVIGQRRKVLENRWWYFAVIAAVVGFLLVSILGIEQKAEGSFAVTLDGVRDGDYGSAIATDPTGDLASGSGPGLGLGQNQTTCDRLLSKLCHYSLGYLLNLDPPQHCPG